MSTANPAEATLNSALANAINKFVEGTGTAADKVGQVASSALDKTGDAILWSVDQAKVQIPDIIHQYLLWSFFESFLPWLLGVVFLIASIYFPYKSIKATFTKNAAINKKRLEAGYCEKEWIETTNPLVVVNMVWLFVLLPSAISTFSISSYVWLKIAVAPKLFLIEKAAALAVNTARVVSGG